MQVPFNRPYTPENAIAFIKNAIESGHLSGNGGYTKRCHTFIKNRYKLKECFLTSSCTDALEMSAMLLNIKPGDEVIMPSFTFVSTALAFHRQGATIRFVDSKKDYPGMDELLIEPLINKRTRAIVPVHYAGTACDMDIILALSGKYGLYVVEDAAHAIESCFNGKQLGTLGNLGCFSFHETKNIHCGEGGLLLVNDESLVERAEILWEKGTNRASYFRGDSSFYEWKDIGSSFLPSELNAAFLYAQLESLAKIQARRISIWNIYFNGLRSLAEDGHIIIPKIPDYATNNGNSFYFLCRDLKQREELLSYLHRFGIMAISHYLPLHKSQFYSGLHDGRKLPFSELYAETLVRLPLYYDLNETQVSGIIEKTIEFFKNK